MEKFILSTIIFVIFIDFLIETLLNQLNIKHSGKPLPEYVQGIYSWAKYRKQRMYQSANTRLGQIESGISIVLTVTVLASGLLGQLDSWTGNFSMNPIVHGLLFFGAIGFVLQIVGLPLSLISTFVIEQRFGFNRKTVGLFVRDMIVSLLLGAIIGGGLLALAIWFYWQIGANFWIYVWGGLSAFSVFMSLFYSQLIVPLFNKQKALPEGSLRDAITDFGKKAGFEIQNVFVIDGSKRSTKANAYFTGFGKKRRIVLYDTLMNQLAEKEIVAVLAHEIGHYKHKHVLWAMMISLIQSGIILFLFSIFMKYPFFSYALGAKTHSFHVAMISFGIILTPLNFIISMLFNVFLRKNEFQADNFASKFGLGTELISGLKKLSSHSLSNLNPHPWYVAMHYSHPPLNQRIRAILHNV